MAERSFPRGGKKRAVDPGLQFKSKEGKRQRKSTLQSLINDDIAIHNDKGKSTFKENRIKSKENDVYSKEVNVSRKKVEDLKANVVREGMLVLGRVNYITLGAVHMTLPGHLSGIVPLAHVSEEYSKLVLSGARGGAEPPTLHELFSKEQYLPVKIIECSTISKTQFVLSTSPNKVNSNITSSAITEGMVLPASIQSQEDHGHIINFGIPKVHGFLHSTKTCNTRELRVGQVMRFAIQNVENNAGTCRVLVSTLASDMEKAHLPDLSTFPVHSYVPGLQFLLNITKVVKQGRVVQYGPKKAQKKGFICEYHFQSCKKELQSGTKVLGMLLYVKPLVVTPFFKVVDVAEEESFTCGQIVSARVIEPTQSGCLLVEVLDGDQTNKARCMIPLIKLPDYEKIVADKLYLARQYPCNKELKQVRLGMYDTMGQYYIGNCLPVALKEKVYTVDDIRCGQIVDCIVTSITDKLAKVKIGIGFVRGNVQFQHFSDKTNAKPKINQALKGKVLMVDPATKSVQVTLKRSLVTSNDPILTSYENAKVDDCYLGVVVLISENFLLVLFYGGVKGLLSKKHTNCDFNTPLSEAFKLGQTLKCYVKSCTEEGKLYLSLTPATAPDTGDLLCQGERYKAVVTHVVTSGLKLQVQYKKNKICKGFLPKQLLTDHMSLASSLLQCYSQGQELDVCYLTNLSSPIFTIASTFVQFYKNHSKTQRHALLRENNVVPMLIKDVKSRRKVPISLTVSLPLAGSDEITAIVPPGYVMEGKLPANSPDIVRYQTVWGKLLPTTLTNNLHSVSTKLSDCWDKRLESSLQLLDSYIQDVMKIRKGVSSRASSELGRAVKGVVESGVVRLSDGTKATTVEELPCEATEVEGKVVWFDVAKALPVVTINRQSMNDIAADQGMGVSVNSTSIHARVVYLGQDVTVVALKGKGKKRLAFMPTKRHLNDWVGVEACYSLGEVISVGLFQYPPYLLALDRQVILLKEKQLAAMEAEQRRVDMAAEFEEREENNGEVEIVKENLVGGSDIKEEKLWDDEEVVADKILSWDDSDEEDEEATAVKSEQESDDDLDDDGKGNEEEIDISSSEETDSEPEEMLANDMMREDVGFNWDVLHNNSLLSGLMVGQEQSSGDESDDEENKKTNKKQKMNRKQKAVEEEARLRRAEEELMDADRAPECTDDFDRLVAARPDQSAVWLQYMAFHVQSTDIDKARAVARRALRTISFRKEQEKLNIWLALINLEDLYGTEESMQGAVQEAVQCNDPYPVQAHLLSAHARANRLIEMKRTGSSMLRKYKDSNPEVWWLVGGVYLQTGEVESARAVLQQGMNQLDKSRQVELISKFAQMENKFGNRERAQTMYEHVLSSFPKRVDVWGVYVDMLVKCNDIDMARQVLGRATSQRLPAKKMKILFKKYLSFEESYGTPENVEAVRLAAKDYVENYVDD